MRKQLKAIDGERLRFTARVERFGSKRGWKGAPERTVLLRDVRRDGTEAILTDHLWFTAGKTWSISGLAPGAKIAFDARVGTYEKGYRGRRDDVLTSYGIDYRLERPTRLSVIKDKDIAGE